MTKVLPSGCFLTQIQMDPFIPAVNNKKQRASLVKQVEVDQRVKNILRDFSQVMRDAPRLPLCAAHTVRPLFKKHAAAEKEFCAMEPGGIISHRMGSPWAAPLHMVKKIGRPVKGVRCGLKQVSDVAEILLGQVRQLALLSVRVAGLLSEEAGDQGFVVDQPNLEKKAELFDGQVTGK